MAGIKYSESQIAELKQNKYVKNVTQRHIIFTKACKEEVLLGVEGGLFYKEVFKNMGFPEYVVKSLTPKRNFTRWKMKKETGSIENKKGRPTKSDILDPKNMSKDEYIEYLEMQLAVFQEMQKYIKKYPSKKL